MADYLIDLDEADRCTDSKTQPPEVSGFPQTLVTEKLIFVIDMLLLTAEVGEEISIHTILSLVKNYFNLKKKICPRPPEFECLLYGNKTITQHDINGVKDIQSAFMTIKNIECEEETEPLEIDKIFDKVASSVELPDPAFYKNCLPPDLVYHVIWLFGRNLFVPTIECTNSFDYLMMTPYVALDMLYVYNKSVEANQCEQISQALLGLNENNKGYFLSCSISNKNKMFSCLAQFLGHPLFRAPQLKAKFNIVELGPQIEINENDSDGN